MKHTQGPWEVIQDDEYPTIHGIWSTDEIPTYIARTCFAPRSIANSKLIASAPDMLEVLKECIYALKYAAFNLDGTIDEDVDQNVIESTSPSKTAIIAVRKAEAIIKKATE